jgi:peroxiredoxin
MDVGESFPAFELPGLDGRDWRRTDLLGRLVVLFCFSTW